MIDSLLASLPAARARDIPGSLGLTPGEYAVLTLHRPSNVDDPQTLSRLLRAVAEIAAEVPVVFPVHPRTRARLAEPGLAGAAGKLRTIEPLGYLDFMSLTSGAKLVFTDSGGLQEETTALGIPCITLRENTERPITVDEGTNVVVGSDAARIVAEARRALRGDGKRGRCPALWDGKAGERIADVLISRA
jgi:UDP-N-acetylglucosamine 2-epimerase (non-hydrolysing)